jgi:hypothetical protein
MRKAQVLRVLFVGRKSFKPGIFIVILLIGSAEVSSAQVSSLPDSIRSGLSIVVGIGPNYGLKNESNFTEMASIRYEFKSWFLGIRYFYSSGSLYGSVPDEAINDFGLLCGYNYTKPLYTLSAAAGISYETFILRGKFLDSAYSSAIGDVAATYEELHSHSISIPVQAEAFWTPSDVFGIGLIFFDNINSVKNNYGFLVALRMNLY